MSTDLFTFYAHVFLDGACEVVVRALCDMQLPRGQVITAPRLADALGNTDVLAVRIALQRLRRHSLVLTKALSTRARDEMGWHLNEAFGAVVRAHVDRVIVMLTEESQDVWECQCLHGGVRTYYDCMRECRRGALQGQTFFCFTCRTEPVLRPARPIAPPEKAKDMRIVNQLASLL